MSRRRRLLAAAAAACLALAGATGVASAGKPGAAHGDPPTIEHTIIGGDPATIEQAPWQVALAYNGARYVGNGYQRFLGCGGTLVAPTIVVTAAHCVFDPGVGWHTPELYEVITGRAVLSSAAGQAIGVAAIYRPVRGPGGAPAFEAVGGPDVGPSLYEPKSSRWDVAFLVLAGPSAAPPIQIAGRHEAATWRPGRRAYVSGWGSIKQAPVSDNPPTDQLRIAAIRLFSNRTCARITPFIGRLEVCAGDRHGSRAPCFGDSGGPLVVPVEVGAGLGFRLVGDTSTGSDDTCSGGFASFGRLADNPIRSALAGAIETLAGVDIVGSGARQRAAPRTRIAGGPRRKTRRRRARFRLRAGEPATFQCRLDRGAYEACGPVLRIRAGRGRHQLRVRATDSLGQVDRTSAKRRWRVLPRRRGR